MPKLLLLDDAINLVAALGHLMEGPEREHLLAETAKGIAHLITLHNRAREHAGLQLLEPLSPEDLMLRARAVHPSTDQAVRCLVTARQCLFAGEDQDFADEYILEMLLSASQMFLATVDFLTFEQRCGATATAAAPQPTAQPRPERAPAGVTLH